MTNKIPFNRHQKLFATEQQKARHRNILLKIEIERFKTDWKKKGLTKSPEGFWRIDENEPQS